MHREHGQTQVSVSAVAYTPDAHFPRHLCDLILDTPTLVSKRGRSREDVDRRDFERLNNIEKEASGLHFDHRSIKEDAQREALQAQIGGSASAKKTIRPFQRLVMLQHEKNKRDKYLHDRLSKDKKQEQLRIERRDEYLNKVMRPRKPMTQAQKQHRIKKSYSSAFFQLMRPISSAFTDNTQFTAKRSPAELDFTPSGKPSLVLSVVDAKVAQFVNNERSYTFQLDTEDGGQYLLQAISRQEMTRWIDTVNKVSKIAAKRRLTYLGNSPKPQLSDHIHDPIGAPSASRDPTAGELADSLPWREVRLMSLQSLGWSWSSSLNVKRLGKKSRQGPFLQ